MDPFDTAYDTVRQTLERHQEKDALEALETLRALYHTTTNELEAVSAQLPEY